MERSYPEWKHNQGHRRPKPEQQPKIKESKLIHPPQISLSIFIFIIYFHVVIISKCLYSALTNSATTIFQMPRRNGVSFCKLYPNSVALIALICFIVHPQNKPAPQRSLPVTYIPFQSTVQNLHPNTSVSSASLFLPPPTQTSTLIESACFPQNNLIILSCHHTMMAYRRHCKFYFVEC